MTTTKHTERTLRLVAIVSHSLGEIDILYPIIAELRQSQRIHVSILFVVRHIWNQYRHSTFYTHCEKVLGIETRFIWMPNKFDFCTRIKPGLSPGNVLRKGIRQILRIANKPKLRRLALKADVLLHETTNQRASTAVIYDVADVTNAPVLVYHHGHSLNQVARHARQKSKNTRAVFLSFSNQNSAWANDCGYPNQHIIGFPKLFPEWLHLIEQYNSTIKPYKAQKRVVIFSRGWEDHNFYMEKDLYISMLSEIYTAVRKVLGTIEIVIKPHPRENTQTIWKLLRDNSFENIYISQDHSTVLCRDAILAVSFWTSCVFDSLSLGVPTIEYYREAKLFRNVEPAGSLYKMAGIHSESETKGLEIFLDQLINGNYVLPSILKDWGKVNDLSIFQSSR